MLVLVVSPSRPRRGVPRRVRARSRLFFVADQSSPLLCQRHNEERGAPWNGAGCGKKTTSACGHSSAGGELFSLEIFYFE